MKITQLYFLLLSIPFTLNAMESERTHKNEKPPYYIFSALDILPSMPSTPAYQTIEMQNISVANKKDHVIEQQTNASCTSDSSTPKPETPINQMKQELKVEINPFKQKVELYHLDETQSVELQEILPTNKATATIIILPEEYKHRVKRIACGTNTPLIAIASMTQHNIGHEKHWKWEFALFDTAAGTLKNQFTDVMQDKENLYALTLSADGRYLAFTSSPKSSIKILDTQTGKFWNGKHYIRSPHVQSLCINAENQLIIGSANTVSVTDIKDPSDYRILTAPDRPFKLAYLPNHGFDTKISPRGKYAATFYSYGSAKFFPVVLIWDIMEHKPILMLQTSKQIFNDLFDETINDQAKTSQEYPKKYATFKDVKFSDDEIHITASYTTNGQYGVKIWNLNTSANIAAITFTTQSRIPHFFSYQNYLLTVGHLDKGDHKIYSNIQVWDTKNSKSIASLPDTREFNDAETEARLGKSYYAFDTTTNTVFVASHMSNQIRLYKFITGKSAQKL